MRPPLRRTAAAVVIVAAATIATACGSSRGHGDDALAGSVRTPALHVASVRLPDVTATDAGASRAMRAPAHGLLLVYFGYTHCPDECPATLANLDAAVRRLPVDEAARTEIAFVTVDPARDTPGVLRAYVAHWRTPIRVLRTDNAATLQHAMDTFRATAKVENDMTGSVTHSATTAVVDDRGVVVDELPFGLSAPRMARDLTILFTRQAHPSASSAS